MGSFAQQKPAAKQWTVEPASDADWAGIWAIFHDVIQGGDTYSYAADTPEALARDVWMAAGKYGTGAHAYVVRDAGKIIGTYSLRRNHYGHGAHVANAGYMVHKDYRGQGVAKALCKHSLQEAKRQGCLSMQFNYVVSTNTAAVSLWQTMGFTIIGVSPKSYNHAQHGLVDIYIMHRSLDGVTA